MFGLVRRNSAGAGGLSEKTLSCYLKRALRGAKFSDHEEKPSFLLLLCSLWMLAALPVQAQQMANASSGFSMTSDDLSDPRVPGNLETLCRVWGYAKYHHPVFCDTLCRVDVDSALFALLPKVVHADRDTRNRHLLDWVRSLGDYTPNRIECEQALAPYDLVETADLGWTADTVLLGGELSKLLQDLRYAERDENYYLRLGQPDQGPDYQYLSLRGESFYPTPQMDSGLNLLLLFRLWNVIEYYAPYRAVTLHPWNEVLSTYIPLMGVETDGRRFARLYMRLIRELNDGHAYAPVEMLFGQRMLPVWPLQAEGRLFVGYSGDSALERGDEVLAIDGEPISERLELLREYASRSNEASLRKALRFMGYAHVAIPPRWSAAAPGPTTRSAWQRCPMAASPPFTTRLSSCSRPSACWPIRWVTSTPGHSPASTSPRSDRRCPARGHSSSTCAPTR